MKYVFFVEYILSTDYVAKCLNKKSTYKRDTMLLPLILKNYKVRMTFHTQNFTKVFSFLTQ